MAWTTPKTWATGDVLTAADMNAYVSANTAWLGSDKPVCRVSNSTDEGIVSATAEALNFDTEQFDNANMHAPSPVPARITCPTGGDGVYLIGGSILFAATDPDGTRQAAIRLNGATQLAASWSPGGAQNAGPTVETIYELNATDYVHLMAFQDSGSTINSLTSGTGGLNAPAFYAVWLST